MKKIMLIIMTGVFGYAVTASASCWENEYRLSIGGQGYNCNQSGIDTSGEPASCGEGCSYTYNNGTMTITATKNYGNATLNNTFFAKSYWEGNNFRDTQGNPISVNNILIDGFTSFAGDAFLHSHAPISGKNGILNLNNINWNAFAGDTLAGNIIWSGNSSGGFNNGVKIAGNLIIEDTATVSGSQNSFSLLSGGRVFCKTDLAKCQELLEAAGATQTMIAAAELFPEGCETLSLNADCAECKNSNFSLEYGYCYRKRYTIPEADAATSDDFENTIEWIFE